MLTGTERIAMQYSPRNAIMYVSMVDAGTIEVLRELGKTIVSSADLVSRFEAVLTPEQEKSHYEAQAKIDAILEAGFLEIGRRVRSGAGTTEYAMVEWLQRAMADAGLVWEHGPNVSVNANSANSHYEPTAECSMRPSAPAISCSSISGRAPDREETSSTTSPGLAWSIASQQREQAVFTMVAQARDAAITTVKEAFAAGKPIAGWQADDAARA